MPFIRRTIFAALWGIPVPAIVGSLIPLAIALLVARNVRGDTNMLTMMREAASCWPLPLVESLAGAGYGLVRIVVVGLVWQRPALRLRYAAVLGATFWALFGFPFLVAPWLLLALVVVIFRGGLSEGWLDALLVCLFAYFCHIFAGAVAGFHVEYYVKHGRERAEIVS